MGVNTSVPTILCPHQMTRRLRLGTPGQTVQTTSGLTPATARSDEGGAVEEVPTAETGGNGSQGEFTIAQSDSIETTLDRLSLSQHLQLFQVKCTLGLGTPGQTVCRPQLDSQLEASLVVLLSGGPLHKLRGVARRDTF